MTSKRFVILIINSVINRSIKMPKNVINLNVLVVYGFVVHVVFLISIFQIYFQSPVIGGLSPLQDLDDPPAQRLVLFVADGLRAESFYKNDCSRTKFLKELIDNDKSVFGYSHARVPTESRPGHVALIAGFYEDPSAVAKGWQKNPVDFDSVFNRSRKTFSWGSPDILPIFSEFNQDRIYTDSYDANNEDFSGRINTYMVDKWVFDKVKLFLKDPANSAKVAENKTIFFLHLLGLDTCGHVHKPNSQQFTENLFEVDKGVREIYELVEKFYNYDGKTAYIFTADHGMTNHGSHGAGEKHETETPFMAWGAGITTSNYLRNSATQKIGGKQKNIIHLEQADVAPLIASLIGVSVPVNNVGILPEYILKSPVSYVSAALRNNALQIAKNYKYYIDKFKRARFQLLNQQFKKLEEPELFRIESAINQNHMGQKYRESMQLSKKLIKLSLEGINYYQSYYEKLLAILVTIAMVAWLIFLLQYILVPAGGTITIPKLNVSIGLVISGIVYFMAYLQEISFAISFYFVLPIVCWSLIDYKSIRTAVSRKLNWKNFGLLIVCVVGAELFVLSFFYRQTLTVMLVGMAAGQILLTKKTKISVELATKWLMSSVALAIFPALPVIDKNTNNELFLCFGLALWACKQVHEVVFKRRGSIFALIVYGLFVVNFMVTLKYLRDGKGLMYTNQMFSWVLLVVSFVLPFFSQLNITERITSIGNSLAIPLSMMSLTYEPIFLLMLFINISYWIRVEYVGYTFLNVADVEQDLQIIQFSKSIKHYRVINWNDLKKCFFILLYILISFFGTGNIASVSSFDPSWVRCLVPTFSPFLMSLLIIVKLLIPIILVTCFLKAIQVLTEVTRGKLFLMILLICDGMCLNFLYFVKNQGSWLEIGTSISHFVIMEVTVLVLFCLHSIANFMTTTKINLFKNKNKNYNLLLPKNVDKKLGNSKRI